MKSWIVRTAKTEASRDKIENGPTSDTFPSNADTEKVPSNGKLATSWLPSKAFAERLEFEQTKEHPITSLE